MEKDIGKINKNQDTDIVIRIDDFGGKVGLTIREFTTSERYTGFTKSGTRIPADKFLEFREMINSISLEELKAAAEAASTNSTSKSSNSSHAKQAKLEKKEVTSEDIDDY